MDDMDGLDAKEREALKARLSDRSLYKFSKRLPLRAPTKKTDVYVTKKRNLKTLVKRCQKLLNDGERFIIVHGMGAAIEQAVNVALEVTSRSNGTLGMHTTTSTVTLFDDYIPIKEGFPLVTLPRNNSSIHIEISAKFGMDVMTRLKTTKPPATHTAYSHSHSYGHAPAPAPAHAHAHAHSHAPTSHSHRQQPQQHRAPYNAHPYTHSNFHQQQPPFNQGYINPKSGSHSRKKPKI